MQIVIFIIGIIRGAVISLLSLLSLIVAYWYISVPVIVCLILVPCAFRFVRAALSRLVLILKIKSTVKKKGGKLKLSRFPIASFFINSDKNDMYINLAGEEYAVKYFPGNPLNKKVYIHDLECAYTSRPKAQSLWGRGARCGSRVDVIINKADTKMKKHKLKMASTEQKNVVLVFSPLPYELYVYDGNKYRMTGNGEKFENITMYMGNGVVDFLQRL